MTEVSRLVYQARENCLRHIHDDAVAINAHGVIGVKVFIYEIGSGMVEGACKHVVGRRLKQTGARWKVRRVERMAALCAVQASDQWNAYWATAA